MKIKTVHVRGLGLTLIFTFIQGVLHPLNTAAIYTLHIFYTLFYNLHFCLLRLCIHRSIQPFPSPIYSPVRKTLYSWHKLFIATILVARVRTTLHRPFRNLASESRRCYVAFWLPEQVHEWRQFYQRLFAFFCFYRVFPSTRSIRSVERNALGSSPCR